MLSNFFTGMMILSSLSVTINGNSCNCDKNKIINMIKEYAHPDIKSIDKDIQKLSVQAKKLENKIKNLTEVTDMLENKYENLHVKYEHLKINISEMEDEENRKHQKVLEFKKILDNHTKQHIQFTKWSKQMNQNSEKNNQTNVMLFERSEKQAIKIATVEEQQQLLTGRINSGLKSQNKTSQEKINALEDYLYKLDGTHKIHNAQLQSQIKGLKAIIKNIKFNTTSTIQDLQKNDNWLMEYLNNKTIQEKGSHNTMTRMQHDINILQEQVYHIKSYKEKKKLQTTIPTDVTFTPVNITPESEESYTYMEVSKITKEKPEIDTTIAAKIEESGHEHPATLANVQPSKFPIAQQEMSTPIAKQKIHKEHEINIKKDDNSLNKSVDEKNTVDNYKESDIDNQEESGNGKDQISEGKALHTF